MIQIGLLLATTRILMAYNVIHLEGHSFAGFVTAAHIYIGALGMYWWCNRIKWSDKGDWESDRRWKVWAWCESQPWQWHFFWFMCAVEVFSFFVSRI